MSVSVSFFLSSLLLSFFLSFFLSFLPFLFLHFLSSLLLFFLLFLTSLCVFLCFCSCIFFFPWSFLSFTPFIVLVLFLLPSLFLSLSFYFLYVCRPASVNFSLCLPLLFTVLVCLCCCRAVCKFCGAAPPSGHKDESTLVRFKCGSVNEVNDWQRRHLFIARRKS